MAKCRNINCAVKAQYCGDDKFCPILKNRPLLVLRFCFCTFVGKNFADGTLHSSTAISCARCQTHEWHSRFACRYLEQPRMGNFQQRHALIVEPINLTQQHKLAPIGTERNHLRPNSHTHRTFGALSSAATTRFNCVNCIKSRGETICQRGVKSHIQPRPSVPPRSHAHRHWSLLQYLQNHLAKGR